MKRNVKILIISSIAIVFIITIIWLSEALIYNYCPKYGHIECRKQLFLRVCADWWQKGCNISDYLSSIEERFSAWQPNIDLNNFPNGQSKIDYLAKQCGCYYDKQ